MTDGQILKNTNLSFKTSLWSIKAGSLEEQVQILWNGILNTWFPPSQPYRIGIKAAVLADNTVPDAVVFEIHASSNNPVSLNEIWERQIFMVECKRISEDTTTGWQSAQQQLLGYLIENSNPERCSGMYGACAIGTKVVFYEWIKSTNRLTAISPMYDLAVPSQRHLVENSLDHVKTNGWLRTT